MQKSVSFQITILTLIVSLFILILGPLLFFQHSRFNSIALDSASRTLHEINKSIVNHTTKMFEPMLAFANIIVNSPKVDTAPSLIPHPLSPLIFSFLEQNPIVTSVYLGFNDGSHFQIFNLSPGLGRFTKNWLVPPSARFALRLILPGSLNHRIEIIRFFDQRHLAVGDTRTTTAAYDPRKRPWYLGAIRTAATHVTDFYPFSSTPGVGVTIAHRFDGAAAGVIGIDVTLTTISRFLHNQELTTLGKDSGGSIFIFSANGKILSHSKAGYGTETPDSPKPIAVREFDSILNVDDALTKKIYNNFIINGQLIQKDEFTKTLTVDGKRYAASITPIIFPNGTRTYLSSALPLQSFLQPMLESQQSSLLISLVIFLVFTPIIFFSAIKISRPIRSLTALAHNIRNLEPRDNTSIHSFIREIDDLAHALYTAKSAILNFGKYVPKYVVRQIVETDTSPKLGGQRREISVLFTDLENFTRWSQQIEPEKLIDEMSRYLSGMCDIIEARGGVVDKFVGDAVMAYWNAPLTVEAHAVNACLATLECRDWINTTLLETDHNKTGERLFYTRFGLHLGDAVVGNVGSEERMDFTVLGAPINLGSRLEPLNKYYGTQILVSDQIVSRIDDRFLIRWADTVLPIGAMKPIDVYELVAVRADRKDARPSILATPAQTDQCLAWEIVPRLYRERRWQDLLDAVEQIAARFESDKLTQIYLERAREFVAKPPAPDWDFVTVYLSKR